MTARKKKQDEGTIILTRGEAALIRRALADCYDVIDRPREPPTARPDGPAGGGPGRAGGQPSPGHVQSDASLAIDHIDFPRLGRSGS